MLTQLEKHRKLILILILFTGFALRYFAAKATPIVFDEIDDFASAKKICLNPQKLNLPLVDTRTQSSNLYTFKYLIRLGWDIFGETLLGARLPFVILGTCIILLVYFFVKVALGASTALLASFLLSINQYDIGVSRIANINPPQVLFYVLSLFVFYRSLVTSNNRLILLNGVIIGAGYYIKETMIFLIPIYIIFLSVCPEFKDWQKNKYLWLSFGIALCIMSIPIYLNLANPQAPRFDYIYMETAFGISLNAIGFYLGELILLLIKPFPEFFDYVSNSLDREFPILNFVCGLLILIAVLKSLKRKEPFIRLLVVSFIFNFVFFCFLRRKDVINSIWSLGSLDWSIFGLIPGLILASHMLIGFVRAHKLQGSILFIGLLTFMLIRTWDIVTYPLNCFFPTKDYFIREQLGWAMDLKDGKPYQYTLMELNRNGKEILPGGNLKIAEDTFKAIYKVTGNQPIYKEMATLGLAEVLYKEGKYKESKKYLDEILLLEPNNSIALRLKDEIKLREQIKSPKQ